MTPQLQRQLENLPTDPGIYKYFDADSELIYVGKAVNLRNRVKSYFVGNQHSPKTQILVSRIVRLETIVVQSEVDALILETNLIKEFRPRYNIILKDDKSHLYIKITLYEDLPRVSTCRQTDIKFDPKASYFGPFPSSGTAKQTLRYLRRVFPYLARHQPPMVGRRRPPQSFFYYNLPLGPVDKDIDKKQYRQQIFQLVHFLEGKRLQVEDELIKEMRQAAKQLDFERAAAIKQQLDGLAYISQQIISPDSYIANPELMADKREQGLTELATTLAMYWPALSVTDDQELRSENDVREPLHRIECYDISNLSGQQAVGSMVVFEDGEAKKSDYRKFKIKMDNRPNDFAMLQEVLRRRFKRLMIDGLQTENKAESKPQVPNPKPDSSFATVPDLIIIDGGKGQLSAAQQVLDELTLAIPVVGMTKREEELVLQTDPQPRAVDGSQLRIGTDLPMTKDEPLPDNQELTAANHSVKPKRSSAHGSFARTKAETATQTMAEAHFTIIKLARGSEPLFLIQRIRDEAHRFAITYHRKLRGKEFLKK